VRLNPSMQRTGARPGLVTFVLVLAYCAIGRPAMAAAPGEVVELKISCATKKLLA
jgi:hypothetical protein